MTFKHVKDVNFHLSKFSDPRKNGKIACSSRSDNLRKIWTGPYIPYVICGRLLTRMLPLITTQFIRKTRTARALHYRSSVFSTCSAHLELRQSRGHLPQLTAATHPSSALEIPTLPASGLAIGSKTGWRKRLLSPRGKVALDFLDGLDSIFRLSHGIRTLLDSERTAVVGISRVTRSRNSRARNELTRVTDRAGPRNAACARVVLNY